MHKCELLGKRALTCHSASGKHIRNVEKGGPVKNQLSISESLSGVQGKDKKEQELLSKTNDFEISLARSLSYHNIGLDFLIVFRINLKSIVAILKLFQK